MSSADSSLFPLKDSFPSCSGESILGPNTFDHTEFPSLSQNTAPNPSLSARPNYGESYDATPS